MLTEVAWVELIAVTLISLVMPLINLLTGLLRPSACGTDQFLGLAPSTLLVVLGSVELVLVPLSLVRLVYSRLESKVNYHAVSVARFIMDATLCFLLGAALFPTATAGCFASQTFCLLVVDFALYIGCLQIVFSEWVYLGRDAVLRRLGYPQPPASHL